MIRQFDICRLRQPNGGLVVVLQHDDLDELSSLVVAPLSDVQHRHLIAKLRLEIQLPSGTYILQIDRLAAIPRAEVESASGSLVHEQFRIKNAIDLLFFGV